jgi:hypothetical protein
MGRKKKLKGYIGMCARYDVTETTTHKTVLEDGTILRTDMEGFYIRENMAWFGNENTVWVIATDEIKPIEDMEWEEDFFTRNYEMEKDVS